MNVSNLLTLLLTYSIAVTAQRPKLNPEPYDRNSNLLPGATPDTCRVDDFPIAPHEAQDGGLDPNLIPMEYTIYKSDGSEEKGMTLVYKRPHVSTFYNNSDVDADAKEVVKPSFNGIGVKFINMSPYKVTIYWTGVGSKPIAQGEIDPYQATGTCSFPGHNFHITKSSDPSTILKEFVMQPDTALYFYDPIEDGVIDMKSLSKDHLDRYYAHLTNKRFAEQYKEFTGSEWLAMFPKARPTHKMWRADYFDQVHTIKTNETHYAFWPPQEMLSERVNYEYRQVPEVVEKQIRPHDPYRKSGELELTLRVLSVVPRVFMIDNFLSDVEVDHLLELGRDMDLHESTTGQEKRANKSTSRTSRNTWVDREQTSIVDTIYRRAADVIKIDEALLRWRHEEEDHISRKISSRSKICESLQLVHYDLHQQYTAHHDFGYPKTELPYQDARFATLLLYLNDVEQGGETTFPRWVNGHTPKGLSVKPKRGQAVLFYSEMPDGNDDDVSQHAAEPIRRGEKWLTNLWIRDPHFERHE